MPRTSLGSIVLDRQTCEAGVSPYYVPLFRSTNHVLQQIGAAPEEHPVVCDPSGAPLEPSRLISEFESARKASGLPAAVDFSVCRHTFAGCLIRSGSRLTTTAVWLGAGDIAAALPYAALCPKEYTALERPFGWLDAEDPSDS